MNIEAKHSKTNRFLVQVDMCKVEQVEIHRQLHKIDQVGPGSIGVEPNPSSQAQLPATPYKFR